MTFFLKTFIIKQNQNILRERRNINNKNAHSKIISPNCAWLLLALNRRHVQCAKAIHYRTCLTLHEFMFLSGYPWGTIHCLRFGDLGQTRKVDVIEKLTY